LRTVLGELHEQERRQLAILARLDVIERKVDHTLNALQALIAAIDALTTAVNNAVGALGTIDPTALAAQTDRINKLAQALAQATPPPATTPPPAAPTA